LGGDRRGGARISGGNMVQGYHTGYFNQCNSKVRLLVKRRFECVITRLGEKREWPASLILCKYGGRENWGLDLSIEKLSEYPLRREVEREHSARPTNPRKRGGASA